MIKRYTREEMGALWNDENRFRAWLKVEVAACEAMAELGIIPKEAAKNIAEKADFNVERILEIEKETKHDVIAFLTNVAEYVGPDSRFVHKGMTSSDVLDTSFAWLLKKAGEMILEGVDKLLAAIKKQAMEHKFTPMVGRSHGIHAEPITFGLKMAVLYDEVKRNRVRIEHAIETISYGQVSGAVGTFANTPPEVEALVCKKLGLKPAPASTQIIQRDRHAEYFSALAIMACTIDKIAVEIRHLQRTEVLEAQEYFSKGQKGSSAMPHKRNPIGSENMSGLARVVRANAIAAMENVALWHERDISHSSVERVIGPDSTILIDYMLHRVSGLVGNLVVNKDRMMENLNLMKGLIFSQQILLALAEAGVSREDAYKMVQTQAMRVWDEGADFKTLVLACPNIGAHLSKEAIEEIFDLDYHFKHVDTIFKRVFGE
ncbi:Adenylosuccinate lyase [Desulfatibacillum alkenivorans DSM 16219]|jgi:adenylosuccinate lyase|uniref:Adenylosuccinate lyase n=1 Tax=Desulfatibacillum alkenivorans DSM 16219 TaxID=1121393 RepID=A0A1M6PQA1_9BACT|nr:adenylosuccinate lyase [Desulfatibacillum alkenivorans]SHK10159.1 Adenylosuccinate lyase [Desulfatibacillum alkenivorans DSM 16219]